MEHSPDSNESLQSLLKKRSLFIGWFIGSIILGICEFGQFLLFCIFAAILSIDNAGMSVNISDTYELCVLLTVISFVVSLIFMIIYNKKISVYSKPDIKTNKSFVNYVLVIVAMLSLFFIIGGVAKISKYHSLESDMKNSLAKGIVDYAVFPLLERPDADTIVVESVYKGYNVDTFESWDRTGLIDSIHKIIFREGIKHIRFNGESYDERVDIYLPEDIEDISYMPHYYNIKYHKTIDGNEYVIPGSGLFAFGDPNENIHGTIYCGKECDDTLKLIVFMDILLNDHSEGYDVREDMAFCDNLKVEQINEDAFKEYIVYDEKNHKRYECYRRLGKNDLYINDITEGVE